MYEFSASPVLFDYAGSLGEMGEAESSFIYSVLVTLYGALPCQAPSREPSINSAQPSPGFINANRG